MGLSYIRKTVICKRCGSQYSEVKEECPYCSNLSDSEVKVLRKEYLSQLGPVFPVVVLVVALVYAVFMLLTG